MNDTALRAGAAVFVVFAAVLALMTVSVWAFAAILVGAGIALVEHYTRK